MLISDHYGREKRKGLFGLEIEVEGKKLPDKIKGWNTDRGEGSLRDGGLEYVLPSPKDKAAALKRVKDVADCMSENGSIPVFSPRTSCHVHVNIGDLTIDQACTMYLLSLLAEPFLSGMCGDLREGNHFCLRGIDAESILVKAGQIFRTGELPPYGREERYAFTNLASVATFGSLEYRGMRGTLDLELWNDWLSILGDIKEAAIAIETPKNLMEKVKEVGASGVLSFYNLLPSDKYRTMNAERVAQSESVATFLLTSYLTAGKKEKRVPIGIDNPFKAAMIGEFVVQVQAEEW
jgi:hypothetical protein